MRHVVIAVERSIEPHTSQVLPSSLNWLYNVAPSFGVNGDQISILQKPEDFYHTLLEQCKNAKRRIYIASLYLGTGNLEKRLVDTLSARLNELGERLQVNILLDANRGSRGLENSRTMLTPLIKSYPHCRVSLFHTPALRGPLRFLLPPRYNELIGLQHIKLYLFDDSVIVSGANLSHDYFTNRQDRYFFITCPELADFYYGLLQRISSISLVLNKNDELTPNSSQYHPFNSPKHIYISEAKKQVWGYYQTEFEKISVQNHSKSDVDTIIFPLLELPPIGVHQDSTVTERILECAASDSVVNLTTGYFNLTDSYRCIILGKSQAKFNILVAHPSANGFLKAAGPAGGIPSAYTSLATSFLSWTNRLGQTDRVSVLEYQRPGWTFHAKGLWQSFCNNQIPFLTVIGSSNFGVRSVNRDLESQVVIVTENEKLKSSLLEEQKRLYDLGTPFTLEVASLPERKPPFWVRTLMWFFKKFL
ncbi:phosphatidylglycerophosphate synthase 1 [Lycorma delicatula]|uniref:phosphatidylglycerophosphate synthase 1 n=1 Tax=Lycorma delicatula TaxID=130591 RepID=UPI003F510F8F